MSYTAVLLPFGKTILQTTRGQSVSSDNTCLVNIILENEGHLPLSALDLGSGNGILSIMLAHYRPSWQITALELQPHLAELATQNCQSADTLNVTVFNQDLRLWKTDSRYELIFSNPPFFRKTSGHISPIREKAISRHEITCTLQDILNFIRRFLKPAGKAYLIYPQQRREELEKYAKKVDLNIDGEFSFKENKKVKIVFLLSQRK